MALGRLVDRSGSRLGRRARHARERDTAEREHQGYRDTATSELGAIQKQRKTIAFCFCFCFLFRCDGDAAVEHCPRCWKPNPARMHLPSQHDPHSFLFAGGTALDDTSTLVSKPCKPTLRSKA